MFTVLFRRRCASVHSSYRQAAAQRRKGTKFTTLVGPPFLAASQLPGWFLLLETGRLDRGAGRKPARKLACRQNGGPTRAANSVPFLRCAVLSSGCVFTA